MLCLWYWNNSVFLGFLQLCGDNCTVTCNIFGLTCSIWRSVKNTVVPVSYQRGVFSIIVTASWIVGERKSSKKLVVRSLVVTAVQCWPLCACQEPTGSRRDFGENRGDNLMENIMKSFLLSEMDHAFRFWSCCFVSFLDVWCSLHFWAISVLVSGSNWLWRWVL